MKLTLFTSETCAFCPVVKSQLVEKKVDFDLVSIDDSPELASEHGIMSVPSIVDSDNQVHRGLQASLKVVDAL